MSLDLTLLPFDGDLDGRCFSHTILPLQTNSRNLMEEIEEISRKKNLNSVDFITDEFKLNGEVETSFTCYLAKDKEGESSYGEVFVDAWGRQMRWIRAKELLKFKDHLQVNRNPKNKAAWGFLAACPPETKVALYWS